MKTLSIRYLEERLERSQSSNLVISIQKNNKELALKILMESFQDNPNLQWMVNGKSETKIHAICEFCLELSIIHKGAYFSKDRKGILLAFQKNVPLSLIAQLKLALIYGKFILKAIHPFRIKKILKQQAGINDLLPKSPYLYCLMMANSKSNKDFKTALDLRDYLFALSKNLQLPVYAQTSLKRNKILFQRAGFEPYASYMNTENNFNLWLLKNENHGC